MISTRSRGTLSTPATTAVHASRARQASGPPAIWKQSFLHHSFSWASGTHKWVWYLKAGKKQSRNKDCRQKIRKMMMNETNPIFAIC